jgi:hypothetical protein
MVAELVGSVIGFLMEEGAGPARTVVREGS